MTIEQLILDVLEKEGGYVHDPLDRGGPTNMGITQATLSRHMGRPASIEDVRRLNQNIAFEIYERDYYRAPRIDGLPEQIQPFVFDCAVNHGPSTAIRMIQQVCNAAGFGPIDEDGVCGPATRDTAQKAQLEMGDWFTRALVEQRRMTYRRIVHTDPSQARFLNGWLARADSFDLEIV